MEDDTLKSLKEIKVPEVSNQARIRAITAGLDAFEAGGAAETAAEKAALKKNEKNTQGSPESVRPTIGLTQQLWRWIMKKQMIAGTALATLVVGVFTYQGYHSIVNSLDTASVASPETEANMATAGTKKENREQSAPAKAKLKPAKQTTANVSPVAKAPAIPHSLELPTSPANRPAAPPASPPPPRIPMAKVAADQMGNVAPAPVLAPPPTPPRIMKQEKKAYGVRRKDGRIASGMVAPGVVAESDYHQPHYDDEGRDQFEEAKTNPIKQVSDEPVSTFSIDVDTASYTFVRKQLNQGRLPQKDAVRVEEMINYFDYNYPKPESTEVPFKPTVAVYPSPWDKGKKLLHIGIKGYEIQKAEKPRSNLVFLLDVSGSMNSPDKLPLLKNAFSMMVENLDPEDTVAIVTYAGHAGTALEPTKVSEKHKILNALSSLHSGGSTAGAQGIKQAYALAEANFDKEGVNRVILATDGDFNVGITNREELKSYIEHKRETGIFLSVLGFGQGNYNDALMQKLAQHGNGNAAYIDTLSEARKVLVEEAGSTLFPIAKDVKIQIEFNPGKVAEYRLVGYETRMLNREDFNNDKIDAGDIGSGHTVTAIYELTPPGSESLSVDDLRYQKEQKEPVVIDTTVSDSNEYAFLKMRYKLPEESKSKLISQPITPEQEVDSVDVLSTELRFAAAVAGFGQLLRGGEFTGQFNYDDVIALARDARGEDAFGYRSEFMNLVRLAKSIRAR